MPTHEEIQLLAYKLWQQASEEDPGYAASAGPDYFWFLAEQGGHHQHDKEA